MNTHSLDRSALRDALRAQIQEAWTQNFDVDLPFRLARENPSLADDLLSFFDWLVSGEIDLPSDMEQDEAARRLTARLRQTGRSHLADALDRVRSSDLDEPGDTPDDSGTQTAAPGHLSLVSLPDTARHDNSAVAAQHSGPEMMDCQDYYDYAAIFDYGPAEIAKALDLPIATTHQLIINSTQCPPRAQQHIARTTADGLPQTDYSTALVYLVGSSGEAAPRQYQRAASRASDYEGGGGFSYRAVFENAPSSLSDEKRQFWLSLADDPSPSLL